MEKWYKINDERIEDYYLISKDGNILNTKTKHISNFSKNGNNYVETVFKCKDGICRILSVHRLVAKTFIPNPNNYPVVDHIDSNVRNNNVSNLRWCTIKQNNQFRMEKEKKLGIKRGGKRVFHTKEELKKWKEENGYE